MGGFCQEITGFVTFSLSFSWKLIEIWEKLLKTMGASTHTFKKCGRWSTHSTHISVAPGCYNEIHSTDRDMKVVNSILSTPTGFITFQFIIYLHLKI